MYIPLCAEKPNTIRTRPIKSRRVAGKNQRGHYLHGELAVTSAVVLAPALPAIEPAITCNPIHFSTATYRNSRLIKIIIIIIISRRLKRLARSNGSHHPSHIQSTLAPKGWGAYIINNENDLLTQIIS